MPFFEWNVSDVCSAAKTFRVSIPAGPFIPGNGSEIAADRKKERKSKKVNIVLFLNLNGKKLCKLSE